jgi:hypothetical protein
VNRLACFLDGAWGTVTMGVFWHSLIDPPLVLYSGHVWPYPLVWSEPRPSGHPDDWAGLVEVDLSRCERCGYQPMTDWRVFG